MSESPPDYVIEAARLAGAQSPCAKSQRGVAMFKREDADWIVRNADKFSPENMKAASAVVVAATGFNGQPAPFQCTGSELCRRDCAQLCMHAEERAIRAAGALDDVKDLELVHVKVVNGAVVPGKGPCCAQCSRLVAEAEIRGVWLYETSTELPDSPSCPSATCPMCTGEHCNFCGASGMPAMLSSKVQDLERGRRGIAVPVIVGGCEHDVIERHAGAEPSTEPPQGVWRFYPAEKFHETTLRTLQLGGF